MEIHSKYEYPSNQLSNFAGHSFLIDNVKCNSMEGFLQSLKFKTVKTQKTICLLVGIRAKEYGENKNWHKTQILYWKNKEYKRKGKLYKELITRAYDEMFEQCEEYKKALLATNNKRLTHKIGKIRRSKTVFTRREFIDQLKRLRRKL